MRTSDQPRAGNGRVWTPRVLSDSRFDPQTRRLIAAAVAVVGCAVVIFSVYNGLSQLPAVDEWTTPPLVYQKDFLAGYLLADAMAKGIDPFLPLSYLSALHFGGLPAPFFDHPTPHPPTLGLLLYPFTLLDYLTAARLWLWLEFAFLFGAFTLLARELKLRYSALWALVAAPISLAWFPVSHELQVGQVSILLLLILAGSWIELRRGRRLRSGLLLGLALLVKPIAWPCVLVFLLRKEWRGLVGAMGVTGIGYLAAGWVIGLNSLFVYFLKVGPEVSAYYEHWAWNFSLWTIGPRLFEGTEKVVSPPLLFSTWAAKVTAVAIPGLVVLLLLYLVWRRPGPLESAFAAAVGISLVVNPVAWPHYPVIALIPLTQLVVWLVEHGLPAVETRLALISAGLLFVGNPYWQMLAFFVANRSPDGPLALPLAPSLILLGPMMAILALSLLTLHVATRGTTRSRPWTAATG